MTGDFKKKVYRAAKKVPAGRVTSYKEIARYMGTKAYRLIGRALSVNPYAPVVPCHRVVRSDGSLGGYSAAGGIKEKISLLKKEGVYVKNNKVVDFSRVFYSLS